MEKRLILKNVQDQSFDNNVSSILDQYVFKMSYIFLIFVLNCMLLTPLWLSYEYDIWKCDYT